MKKSLLILFIFFSVNLLTACSDNNVNEPANTSEGDLSFIKLPAGFNIEYYSDNVPGARSMVFAGEENILFIGTRGEGKVYALLDTDGDMVADEKYIVAEGLDSPNGVALRNGDLYVAEINRVIKFPDIFSNYMGSPSFEIINNNFPSDKSHGWKYIAFGPDEKLYVPVGAPCNVCLNENEIYASITRMDPDGTNLEIYAEGIRNTVGFDWHPETNILWFTDNGRDWMGDNRPPDELNRAPEKGMHFGFPFCHGGDIEDPDFTGRNCNEFIPPVQKLGPHVAALGMKFYTGAMFPEEYKNQIFIAEHGSWNRDEKIGYRVIIVRLSGTEATSYEPFAEGWLQGESVSGRPVDVELLPDGSMLVSDDYAGAVYRIYYD